MANKQIIDRRLPERSKLMFYFPNVSEGEPYTIIDVPFFENIRVSERKRARFKKYSLISRSSNLYTYLGADSRQLDLEFHITLPHIMDDDQYTDEEITKRSSDSSWEKKRFSPNATPDENFSPAIRHKQHYLNLDNLRETARQILNEPGPDSWGASLKRSPGGEVYEQYIRSRYSLESTIGTKDGPAHFASSQVALGMFFGHAATYHREKVFANQGEYLAMHKTRAIDLIIYWINIIRASVVNNADNPLYGPPILRLKHGIMYQNIPCICQDYRIDWEENMGYDIDTLLPRRIKVALKLEELRTGDFGKFDRNDIIGKDNLAGWEAVIDEGTMDPGTTDLGRWGRRGLMV